MFLGAVAAGVVCLRNPIIGTLAASGIGIWSIVDAIKNATSESKVVAPKKQNQDLKVKG